tara:strand:- start:10 stop:450 length:441 start_codon:yes stop_codon:yes gene_type:complete
MLVELAAFNVAVATVKEAAKHSGDIMKIFKGMGQMMTQKEKIQKVVSKKGTSDLEAYAAYHEMKEGEREVVEFLKWSGHWPKYLQFCSERRAAEKEQVIEKTRASEKRKAKIKEIILIVVVGITALLAIGIVIGLIATVKAKSKGL